MQEVKVKKEELLKKLKSNLKKHKKDYKEAIEARQEKAIKKISEFIPGNALFCKKDIPETLSFPMPKSNVEGYEEAIEMVKMSIDDEITLTKPEFNQYVLDKWSWKRDFDLIKASYS